MRQTSQPRNRQNAIRPDPPRTILTEMRAFAESAKRTPEVKCLSSLTQLAPENHRLRVLIGDAPSTDLGECGGDGGVGRQEDRVDPPFGQQIPRAGLLLED